MYILIRFVSIDFDFGDPAKIRFEDSGFGDSVHTLVSDLQWSTCLF